MKQTENYQLTIYEPNDITSYLTAQGWNGTMNKIDSYMKSIETSVLTNATDIATLEVQANTAKEQIETLQSDTVSLQTAVAGNTSNIAGLNTRVIDVETKVQDLTQKVGNTGKYYGVLSKGETTLAIEIGEFTDNSMVDIYTSVYGLSPTSAELRAASSGQPNLCVTTWPAQSADVNVGVRIDN